MTILYISRVSVTTESNTKGLELTGSSEVKLTEKANTVSEMTNMCQNNVKTIMHFSRMRTACSAQGVSVQGVSVHGVSVQGVPVQGGLCSGGLCPGVSVPGSLSRGFLFRGVSVRTASYWNAFFFSVSCSFRQKISIFVNGLQINFYGQQFQSRWFG